jgi:hypothetical protein
LILARQWWHKPLIPALVYRASSRTARATQKNHFEKTKKKKNKKKGKKVLILVLNNGTPYLYSQHLGSRIRGLGVQRHPLIHTEFETSLRQLRP